MTFVVIVYMCKIVTIHLYFQNMRELESLNLMLCTHLSDRSLDAIAASCKSLQMINLCGIPLSGPAIIQFVLNCPHLHHLDIWGVPNLCSNTIATLTELGCTRNVTVVHKDITDTRVAPVCPNSQLVTINSFVT